MTLEEYAAQYQQEAQEAQKVVNPLARAQEIERAAAADAAEVYKRYQENTKRSANRQSEILRGIKQGEPLASLFLKAVDTIAALTDNRVFYETIERDLQAIYGEALHDPGAAGMTAAAIQGRLDRLRTAEATAGPAERARITAAIKAHEAQLQRVTE